MDVDTHGHSGSGNGTEIAGGIEKRLANLRPWPPGQSGNPAGPRRTKTLKELARQAEGTAFERLFEILTDNEARHSDVIKAAQTIFAYSRGLPKQVVKMEEDGALSPQEAMSRLAAMLTGAATRPERADAVTDVEAVSVGAPTPPTDAT